jgi:proteasome lid subunit RPN8/RPN11
MIVQAIVLAASQRAQIVAIAERTYPEECCGLLVGHDAADGRIVVARIVESRNIRSDRARDRFEIDPQVRITVERELRTSAERVVGHYHSHPDHPARPSPTDLDMAFEPSLVWLIVGVADGRVGEINAFRVNEVLDEFEPVAIV